MKKYKWLFALLFIVLCFTIIFSIAFKKARKAEAEVKKVYQSAEVEIGSYLKEQIISGVYYNSLPINYDINRCIIGCRVDSVDQSGIKHWTGFDILLRREGQTWKVTIVRVDNNPLIPKKNIKLAPWDFLIRFTKKGI
jgi:uncharacterized membrane protein (DUF485 family)